MDFLADIFAAEIAPRVTAGAVILVAICGVGVAYTTTQIVRRHGHVPGDRSEDWALRLCAIAGGALGSAVAAAAMVDVVAVGWGAGVGCLAGALATTVVAAAKRSLRRRRARR